MWILRMGAVLAAAMMFAAGSARADFVIVNGQTVFLTQILTFNQTGTIQPGGAILTLGDGVFAGSGNTIDNQGRIATTGVGAFGITALNRNTISNSGSISTLGAGAFGITALDDNSISNSGSISTLGAGAFGITVLDDNAISNSGTISTLGGGAFGITALDNNSISNTGTIRTLGAIAHGVQFFDGNTFANTGTVSTLGVSSVGLLGNDNNTIGSGGVIQTRGLNAVGISLNDDNEVTNSGSISTSGGAAHGILVNDNNTVTNTGVISTEGLIAHGIQGATNNTVINSGLLHAEGLGSAAVMFTGGGNTLRLLPGSVITGPLDFAAGNTLQVGNGLSIANTFTNNLPASIETGGAPFAVRGLEVAVVDPTALALADDIFFDLTDTISGSVLSRLGGMRRGGAAGQTVAMLTDDPLAFASSPDGGGGPEAWVQAFGLARAQDGVSPAVGADHDLAGVIAGMDAEVAADARAGFFVGGSMGELDVKYDSQNEDIDSAFGGFYLGYETGAWDVDFVVTGGWSGYDLKRNIANNTVPGGAETASADYDGYFIAPELAVSRTAQINGHDVIPSLRLGYAGTWLDGYTETGSSGAITVDDRDVQLLTGRLQVAVPVRIPAHADTVLFEPYVGVEGRTRLDDSDVDAVLLGQNISFDPGGDDSIGAVLAGFELTAQLDDGFYLFGRLEGGIESDSGQTVAGQAGLQFTF